MNKMITLLSSFLLIALCSYTQQGIRFHIQFKPESKYNETIKQSIFSEINFSGSKELMASLDSSGTKNPMITKLESVMEALLKTGKANNAGTYPISMEIVKSNTESNMPSPAANTEGTVVYGHCSLNAFPAYDSVYSPKMEPAAASQLLEIMSKSLSNIKMPDKEMKPGENVTQETPVSVPLGTGGSLDMLLVTNYKLKSIKNNIGLFDITLTYTAKTTVEGTQFPMTGSGTGKMEYDAGDNYVRNYVLNTDMQMKMKVSEMDMNVKTVYSMLLTMNKESN